MSVLAQVLVGGLSVGSIYALIALALVITHKTAGVPNFAQGEMGMVCAFVAYALITSAGVGFPTAVAATLLFAFAMGVLFEVVVLRRMRASGHLNEILATIGFMLLLFGIAGWMWGGQPRAFPFPWPVSDVVQIGELAIGTLSLATIAIASLSMVACYSLFRFTRVGFAMRATQQDHKAAVLSGIPVRRMIALAFGISSVLGALAAILTAPLVTLDPTLMWDPLLKGFTAAVLGGLGSPVGAVLGGYLLGVGENLFGAYVSIEYKSPLAFLLLMIVLLVRPRGLLGTVHRRRA